MLRAYAEGKHPKSRFAIAKRLCRQMVEAYWTRTVPPEVHWPIRDVFQPFQYPDAPDTVVSTARNMGDAASALSHLEAAYHFGRTYTALLPAHFRSQFGIYYTPPALADRLIDSATSAGVDWATCRVLDPACGGGAFLAPIADRMLRELEACSPAMAIQSIAGRLRGSEIDPFAAWLSQVCLDAVMWRHCLAARKRMPSLVTISDSLTSESLGAEYDLVIGNPPYGRLRLAPRLRAKYARSLYGHANVYGVFTDLATRLVRDGGIIAFVTPTGFLAGEYFKNLRSLLANEAPPVSIDFVTARKGIFDDVLQETLLAIYKRTRLKQTIRTCAVTPCDGALNIQQLGTARLPRDSSQPWIMPRDEDRDGLARRLTDLPDRLVNWGYTVSTGPLVWNRHKGQLRDKKISGCFPLIWAECVTSDGQFILRAEKRTHQPYFKPARGDDWLLTRETCVLLQRTTAKEQSRRLVAACLPDELMRTFGAAIVENHLNMLRPLGLMTMVEPDVLAAFLNSAAADRAFRCVSGSVAVSAYELESLPLPSPELLAPLRSLVKANASRGLIDTECFRLYGAGQ